MSDVEGVAEDSKGRHRRILKNEKEETEEDDG